MVPIINVGNENIKPTIIKIKTAANKSMLPAVPIKKLITAKIPLTINTHNEIIFVFDNLYPCFSSLQ